ncbi:50S ribosomal protein L24 [Buchnera aphidicola]|uniref:50S ribosomal protein L24 n=1 Tax=Buchnera aphidicola TaxID=9 RepID=UPI003464D760
MAAKIRSNDRVIILSGKEKGKVGKVRSVIYKKNRLIIEGINLVTKHQKAIPARNQTSQILKKEASIHISNVAFLNPLTNKADRVGFRFEKGKKVRFLKSNNKNIK